MMETLQIFATVTGIIYVYLQISQNKWMWYVNIVSCSAAATFFYLQKNWAVGTMQIYFIVMAIIGILSWRKFEKRDDGVLHLKHPIRRDIIIAAAAFFAGVPALSYLLGLLNDPWPLIDAASAVLGMIAAWWLTRSYLQNWLLWIATDLICATLCAVQSDWWMVAMYALYTAISVRGYFNWKKKGEYV